MLTFSLQSPDAGRCIDPFVALHAPTLGTRPIYTSYRCHYVASYDGASHEAGACPGGPGTAFVTQRDSLKQRLATGKICYYKVRDNRGRVAEAGVCKADHFDEILDAQATAAGPPSKTWWERNRQWVALVGGLGILTGVAGVAGIVMLARSKEE